MVMAKSKKLISSFLRYQYFPHILLTILFCLGSTVIVSFRNLNLLQSAMIMERYLDLVGVFLFAPLFMAEADREIWQLKQSKRTSMYVLYLLRVIVACILLAIAITTFLIILQKSNSQVEFGKMWIGSFCEILFLGSIGFCVSGITNQVVLGYMAAIMYYAANIGNRQIYGKFALFQMTGHCYDFIPYVLGAAVILLCLGMLLREKR